MGVLNLKNKAKVQLFTSWDVWKHQHSTIELYGLDGSMTIPDPNYFGLVSADNKSIYVVSATCEQPNY
jgi:hypothetical protein